MYLEIISWNWARSTNIKTACYQQFSVWFSARWWPIRPHATCSYAGWSEFTLQVSYICLCMLAVLRTCNLVLVGCSYKWWWFGCWFLSMKLINARSG